MAAECKKPARLNLAGCNEFQERVYPSRVKTELSLYRPASALFRFRYYNDSVGRIHYWLCLSSGDPQYFA